MLTQMLRTSQDTATCGEIETLSGLCRLLSGPHALPGPVVFDEADPLARRLVHYARFAVEHNQSFQHVHLDWEAPREPGRISGRRIVIRPISPDRAEMRADPQESFEPSQVVPAGSVAILDRIQDVLLITEAEPFSSPGPRILYVNKPFEQMTGFSMDEVIGLTPRLLQGLETQDGELDKLRGAMKRWEPVTVELINYRKDRSRFIVELALTPLRDEAGWWTYWVAIQRDITARRTQEEVRSANHRKTAVETVASGIAHDLNNQIAIMASQLMNTRRELEAGGSEVIPNALAGLSSIHERLSACKSITSQFMKVTRGLAGTPELIDLPAAVESWAKNAVGDSDIELVFKNQVGTLPPVLVDQGLVSQAINNLLINACQAVQGRETTGKNRIEVTISRSLSAKLGEPSFLVIQIGDNGPGIPETVRSRLFSPYVTTKESASGLGLFVSLSNMATVGGYLQLRNTGPAETVFEIGLPIIEAQAAESAVVVPVRLDRARPMLLVDDQVDLLDALSELICFEGLQVEAVSTAQEAMRKIESNRYSLILCDLNLGGRFVTDKIFELAKGRNPEQRIAVMSGGDIHQDHRLTETLHAYPDILTLTKPFDIASIVDLYAPAVRA